jgi:hypothetical protein
MAIAGCGGGDTQDHACTLIGCLDGFTVTLTNPPSGSYRVEASAPGDPTPHAVDCNGTGPCVIVFRNFRPSTVDISIITASNTTTFTKSPTYTTTFPNGPGCNVCQDGTVTVP